MWDGFSHLRRQVTQQLSDYFFIQLAGERAGDRAWARAARPLLTQRARAARMLSARGDYVGSLLHLRDVARALELAGYEPRPADQPLFILQRDPTPFDALGPQEAQTRVAELEPILERVVALAAAPARAVKYRRLAVAAGLGVALLTSAFLGLRTRENLALHRPVTSSSRAFDTKPEGAVDGLRHGQLGFHSKEESGAWLKIDLEAPHDIERVVVFGRADCCFNQSIPLRLEASLDGQHFERLAEMTEPFSQFEPWRVNLPRAFRARFVRLKTARRALLVASEVEVFGQ